MLCHRDLDNITSGPFSANLLLEGMERQAAHNKLKAAHGPRPYICNMPGTRNDHSMAVNANVGRVELAPKDVWVVSGEHPLGLGLPFQ